jgi:hypothetical protein
MPDRLPRRRPGGLEWDRAAGRYRDRRGRFVSRERVRLAIDETLASHGRTVRQLSEDFRARRVTLAEWETGMRSAIRESALYNAAAARGGWGELSPSDFGRVGAVVRQQLGFLERFARDLARGRVTLDGRFLARAALYVASGRALYHRIDELEMRRRGFDRERNVRHRGDSCDGAIGCIEQSRRGWVAIGNLRPIGTRTCLGHCRCRIRYKNSLTGEVAA